MMFNIGIDVGGTKIEGIILHEGNTLKKIRMPTEAHMGYNHVLANICTVYNDLATYLDNAPNTLGIGTPGSLSGAGSVMANSNIQCFNGKNLYNDLEHLLKMSFVLDNDANCFALAEALLGAGVGYQMVFGVVLGTGCGGGIIIDQKIYHGASSLAGEWGHTSINPNGRPCYCGRKGCVETVIGGGELERTWFEMVGTRCTIQDIFKQSQDGNKEAALFLESFYANFSEAIANIIAVLDPSVVIIGGGLSNIEPLYEYANKKVAQIVNRGKDYSPNILKCALGNSAGSIGAALLPMHR